MAIFLEVDLCECIVRAREHGGAAEAGGSKSAANGQTVTASSWPRVTIRVRETKTRKRASVKAFEKLQELR